MSRGVGVSLAVLFLVAGACGDDDAAGAGVDSGSATPTPDTGPPMSGFDAGPMMSIDSTVPTVDSGPEIPPVDAGGGVDTGPVGGSVRCGDAPPAGAPMPPAPPGYSGGSCPTLQEGRNTITSGGMQREFLIELPSDYDGSRPLPVIMMWHWLRGEAIKFFREGAVEEAVDGQQFIALSMESAGDCLFEWPFAVFDTCLLNPGRLEAELAFFDDVLSCVDQQYNVQRDCVSTAGVSAGALWSSQLMSLRSQYLSSAIILSGGVGGSLVMPFPMTSARTIPSIVLWGGATDNCGVAFETTSMQLESDITSRGGFAIECIHNCGHSVPPLEAAAGLSQFGFLWDFALSHPYWLPTGQSPYLTNGLPASAPSWCTIGSGASIRSGECGPPACDVPIGL